jgi:hypothetical protein
MGGLDFFSRLYTPREKNNYFRYLFKNTDYRQVPVHVRQMILQSKNYGVSIAFEKNSAILIPSTSGKLVSEDEKIILKRFAKVFEQSYVRFLDLKKAEAQGKRSKDRSRIGTGESPQYGNASKQGTAQGNKGGR